MSINNHFQPPWWLKNAHLQTLWAGLIRQRVQINHTVEKLTLPDNDFLDLALTEDNGGPIVLVLHGLQGSINSRYASGILKALHNKGYFAVLMHFRACSNTINTQARLYHAGDTYDAKFVIAHLQKRFPNRTIMAVGFSLGGNVLLKLLGEEKQSSQLKAAVAVSVPMRLDYCANRMNQGFSKLYQWNLIRSLKHTLKLKYADQQFNSFNISKALQSRIFWDIDNHFIAPIHGFKDADDYYTKCSSRQFLKHIQTPTLIIQATDDPFTSEKVIPRKDELSKSVTLEVSEHGGHVGFVSGQTPWNTQYWLEKRIPIYFKQFTDL